MSRLLDLHVHPSLKMHYLPYLTNNFHALVYSGNFWNPLAFQTRYGNISKSPEKLMLCAHYVIERGFVAEGLRWFVRAFSWAAAPKFYYGLRSADPWETLVTMMDGLEKSVPNSNRLTLPGGKKFRLITRYADVATLADDEIGLAHAIEGSHAFGYEPDPGESLEAFWNKVNRRLAYVKERGVAMITLAHFRENMFAPQTDGTEYIPKVKEGKVVPGRDDLIYNMQRADWVWGDPRKLAEPFARRVLELGMLLDVSHTQPHARAKVYDLCAEFNRPVVASHTGLEHFFAHEYNLSDAELKRIHKLGGVAGLILSRRWLVDPVKRYGSDGKGIGDLVENMLYMADLVGDISIIGIGTDFDGLTDPFKDCYTPDQMDRIVEAMSRHFSDDEIDQILYRNGLRVLERGWL